MSPALKEQKFQQNDLSVCSVKEKVETGLD